MPLLPVGPDNESRRHVQGVSFVIRLPDVDHSVWVMAQGRVEPLHPPLHILP